MASFEMTGKYAGAYESEQISDRFTKRLFAIDVDDDYHPRQVFELKKTPKKDNTGLVSPFNPGDEIKVYFNLYSVEHNGNWFQNVVAWKIELVNSTDRGNQGQYNPQQKTEASRREFS